MRKISICISVALLALACNMIYAKGAKKVKVPQGVSVVYYCKNITPENILRLYEAMNVNLEGKVGVKVHFGEDGNINYLNPELIQPLVRKMNATLVETNVLYVGKRRYTESHIKVAKEHGFTFAPIDILDAEGETAYPVEGLKHYTKVKTGSHFADYDAYIVYSHFKGHGSAGFGGAIKNISMGFASPGGKMAMHASAIPATRNTQSCVKCNRCVEQCPADAITITDNGPVIDSAKCLGCAKCIAECALRIFTPKQTKLASEVFLERLVEYAKGFVDQKPMVYITVMQNISKTCDCSAKAPAPFMCDLGAVSSTDLVAVEKACYDIATAQYGKDPFLDVNGVSGMHQIDYAAQLGMGNKKYVLIDIETGEQIDVNKLFK